MIPRFVLWDFGDTLVDQTWMAAAPDGCPEWTAQWFELVNGPLADDWFRGAATAEDIVDHLAQRTSLTPAEVRDHARARCRDIRFFEAPMAAARGCDRAQAIVTVNPDLFSRWIVPDYDLDRLFPVIVTSWEERTNDKTELCRAALDRLGGDRAEEAFLIDNLDDNVRAWKSVGGHGYVFRGEERFAADLDGELSFLRGTVAG